MKGWMNSLTQFIRGGKLGLSLTISCPKGKLPKKKNVGYLQKKARASARAV